MSEKKGRQRCYMPDKCNIYKNAFFIPTPNINIIFYMGRQMLLDYSILLKARHDELIHKGMTLHIH